MKLANLDTAVVNSNTLSNLEGLSPVCTVGAAVLAVDGESRRCHAALQKFISDPVSACRCLAFKYIVDRSLARPYGFDGALMLLLQAQYGHFSQASAAGCLKHSAKF